MTKLELTDVTLRDGLQAESKTLSLDDKFTLFQRLSACGYDRLEIASFVHPKWIPALADSEDLCKKIFTEKVSVETMAFVPNEKGLERFLKFPVPWVSAFVAVSETFNQKNVNASVGETVKALAAMVKRASAEKRKVRIYLSTVFGCPYEGEISKARLEGVLKEVASLGPDEIALSDTIGVALPMEVRKVVEMSKAVYPVEKTALHVHNTYGFGVLNAETAYACGIRKFDGSTGGIGGCPYAKGATGNLATEDLLYLFLREKYAQQFSWKKIGDVLSFLKDKELSVSSRLADIHLKGGQPYGVK